MTAAESTPGTGEATAVNDKVAWPGRILGALLGPPSRPKTVNGRLRYRACAKCAKSVGPLNVVLNLFLMLIKGYLGIVGRSTALVADAIHSGADVISSIMLVFGLRVASKPANEQYPYGYGKVEFLVSVVIYLSLICAGAVIFIDAISTIAHKEQITPSTATLWGAVISIAVNEMMFRQSHCAGTQLGSPSLLANAWEKRSDAFSSIAVFLGIAGAKLGFHFLDPLAAILVAIYILKFSLEMIGEAFRGLLDSALDSKLIEGVRSCIGEMEGVLGVARIRSREIGQNVWIDLEIFVDGEAPVTDVARIKDQVRRSVAKKVERPSKVVVYLKPAPG